MLRQMMIVVLSVLVLAGCDNPAAPTQAVLNNGATPAGDATAVAVLPTSGPREYATGEATLPAPGTAIAPATEDPNAGKTFDSIALNRTGGLDGKPLDIMLLSNGTVTRDGATSTISADQVKQIDDMLDQMGFFGLQGIFQAAGTTADIYTYDITVERGGASRTITAEDGYLPPELQTLIQALQKLGKA